MRRHRAARTTRRRSRSTTSSRPPRRARTWRATTACATASAPPDARSARRRCTQRSREAGFGREVKRRIMLGTYVLSAGYYDAYYLKAQQVRTLDPARLRRGLRAAWTSSRCRPARRAAFPLGERTADPVQMYLVGRLHRQREPRRTSRRDGSLRLRRRPAARRPAVHRPADGRCRGAASRRCVRARHIMVQRTPGSASLSLPRADPRPGSAAVDRHPRHAAVRALDRLSHRGRASGAGLIAAVPDAALASVVGRPPARHTAQGARLARRRRQRSLADGRRRPRAQRPRGWRRQRAIIHVLPRRLSVGARDATQARASSPARRAPRFDHVPEQLRRELLDALNGRTVSRFVPGHLPAAAGDRRAGSRCRWRRCGPMDVRSRSVIRCGRPRRCGTSRSKRCPGYRRTGLAGRAARTLIRYMRLAGRAPVWGALEDNAASRGLAARLGFVETAGIAVFSAAKPVANPRTAPDRTVPGEVRRPLGSARERRGPRQSNDHPHDEPDEQQRQQGRGDGNNGDEQRSAERDRHNRSRR